VRATAKKYGVSPAWVSTLVSRYRPFGLQISAPHYHDRRLLDIAALFEAAFPRARSAPGYETLATVLDVGDVA
jgi:hypothetical protein